MEDLLKIVKSPVDYGLLLEGFSEAIKNEAKEQQGGFLSMVLGTLHASLLGNMLVGKGFIRAGEGTVRAGYGSRRSSLKKIFSRRFHHILEQTLKYESIIRMNLYSMGFILKIISLIK